MKTPVDLLATCRTARRELAMTKLASARRGLDQALAMLQLAQTSVAQAHTWRTELTARCALGAHNDLRESALPACIALVEQRQQDLAQKLATARRAHAYMLERRQEMLQSDRAVVRIDEWKLLQQTQERHDQSRLEDRQADDLVHKRPDIHPGAGSTPKRVIP